jgi:uncharacterized protein YgbK (DUF1537 family)
VPQPIRRQLARLQRIQESQQQEIGDNLRRIQQLQARVAVIDTVEQRRQAWAVEDVVRAAMLALGVAAAEALMERKLQSRLGQFQQFQDRIDPDTPTEPIPTLVLLASGEGG